MKIVSFIANNYIYFIVKKSITKKRGHPQRINIAYRIIQAQPWVNKIYQKQYL